eukprot:gene14930-20082_t
MVGSDEDPRSANAVPIIIPKPRRSDRFVEVTAHFKTTAPPFIRTSPQLITSTIAQSVINNEGDDNQLSQFRTSGSPVCDFLPKGNQHTSDTNSGSDQNKSPFMSPPLHSHQSSTYSPLAEYTGSAFLGDNLSMQDHFGSSSHHKDLNFLTRHLKLGMPRAHSLEGLSTSESKVPSMIRIPTLKHYTEIGDFIENIPLHGFIIPYIFSFLPPQLLRQLLDLPLLIPRSTLLSPGMTRSLTFKESFYYENNDKNITGRPRVSSDAGTNIGGGSYNALRTTTSFSVTGVSIPHSGLHKTPSPDISLEHNTAGDIIMSSQTSTPPPQINLPDVFPSSWKSLGVVWISKDPTWRPWEPKLVLLLDNYLFELLHDGSAIIGYAQLSKASIRKCAYEPFYPRNSNTKSSSPLKSKVLGIEVKCMTTSAGSGPPATFWMITEVESDLDLLLSALLIASYLTLDDMYDFIDDPEQKTLLGRGRFNEVILARRLVHKEIYNIKILQSLAESKFSQSYTAVSYIPQFHFHTQNHDLHNDSTLPSLQTSQFHRPSPQHKQHLSNTPIITQTVTRIQSIPKITSLNAIVENTSYNSSKETSGSLDNDTPMLGTKRHGELESPILLNKLEVNKTPSFSPNTINDNFVATESNDSFMPNLESISLNYSMDTLHADSNSMKNNASKSNTIRTNNNKVNNNNPQLDNSSHTNYSELSAVSSSATIFNKLEDSLHNSTTHEYNDFSEHSHFSDQNDANDSILQFSISLHSSENEFRGNKINISNGNLQNGFNYYQQSGGINMDNDSGIGYNYSNSNSEMNLSQMNASNISSHDNDSNNNEYIHDVITPEEMENIRLFEANFIREIFDNHFNSLKNKISLAEISKISETVEFNRAKENDHTYVDLLQKRDSQYSIISDEKSSKSSSTTTVKHYPNNNNNNNNNNKRKGSCALKLISKEIFWGRVDEGKERPDALVREVLAQLLLSRSQVVSGTLSTTTATSAVANNYQSTSKEYEKNSPRNINNNNNNINFSHINNNTNYVPIVELLNIFETHEGFALELELMSSLDLFDFLSIVGTLPEKHTSHIIAQLIEAISLCNRLGIAHRDIKLSNITFPLDVEIEKRIALFKKKDNSNFNDNNNNNNNMTQDTPINIKLTDFGMAGFLCHDRKLRGRCGTPGYVAPDILKAGVNEGYSLNVDMFSIGVVCYTLLCGYEPFYGGDDDNAQLLLRANKAVEYEFHSPEWDEFSVDAKDFIMRCLAPTTESRLTPDEARKHPWLVEHFANKRVQGQSFLINNNNNQNMNNCNNNSNNKYNNNGSSFDISQTSPASFNVNDNNNAHAVNPKLIVDALLALHDDNFEERDVQNQNKHNNTPIDRNNNYHSHGHNHNNYNHNNQQQ